ncbi:hypothetical protein AB4059_05720 [Lysobacter sp. 2RAF19]
MQTIRPDLRLSWLGTPDAGKQLELWATIGGVDHQLAAIIADDADESLWIEFYVDGKIVQIPVTRLRQALDAAIDEVHSETWYEKNVYPSPDGAE